MVVWLPFKLLLLNETPPLSLITEDKTRHPSASPSSQGRVSILRMTPVSFENQRGLLKVR